MLFLDEVTMINKIFIIVLSYKFYRVGIKVNFVILICFNTTISKIYTIL